MTTFDLVDIVYDRLKTGSLQEEITGDVYKQQRPLNSTKEDVDINALPVINAQVQSAVINVNIHAPNLSVIIDGRTDTEQPDWERLKYLCVIAVAMLTDVWAEDYNFDIQQQTLIKDEIYKDHYINIRLDFFSINISN